MYVSDRCAWLQAADNDNMLPVIDGSHYDVAFSGRLRYLSRLYLRWCRSRRSRSSPLLLCSRRFAA